MTDWTGRLWQRTGVRSLRSRSLDRILEQPLLVLAGCASRSSPRRDAVGGGLRRASRNASRRAGSSRATAGTSCRRGGRPCPSGCVRCPCWARRARRQRRERGARTRDGTVSLGARPTQTPMARTVRRRTREGERDTRRERERAAWSDPTRARVVSAYAHSDTPAICARPRLGRMRVLIVEDEPFLAEAIRDGLRLEAIAADIAATETWPRAARGQCVRRGRAGPRHPRPERRRDRAPARRRSIQPAHADAHRRRPARRQGDRVRERRRRLPHQALRPAGADPAPPCARAPPRGRPPRRGGRRHPARPVPPRGVPRRALRRPHPQAVRRARSAHVAAAAVSSAPRTCSNGLGRERRSLHQRRPHHDLDPAQAPRRTLGDRDGRWRRLPHERGSR